MSALRVGDVHFYSEGEGDAYGEIRAGAMRDFADRPYRSRHFVFRVRIPPGETRACYLRVASETTISIPVHVMTPEAFRAFSLRETLIFGLALGAHLLLLIYNLSLAFFLKSRIPCVFW